MTEKPHQVFFSKCTSKDTLAAIMKHELLHALGVNHEQSRSDRDSKVKVRSILDLLRGQPPKR